MYVNKHAEPAQQVIVLHKPYVLLLKLLVSTIFWVPMRIVILHYANIIVASNYMLCFKKNQCSLSSLPQRTAVSTNSFLNKTTSISDEIKRATTKKGRGGQKHERLKVAYLWILGKVISSDAQNFSKSEITQKDHLKINLQCKNGAGKKTEYELCNMMLTFGPINKTGCFVNIRQN